MLNEGDFLARNFHYFFPLLLALWLLPWVVLAAWLDRSRLQFTLAAVMWATALACIELGAGYWLGFGVVASGIVGIGVFVFLPTLLAQKVMRWRERRLPPLDNPVSHNP